MRIERLNPGYVPAGSALTLSKAIHDGKLIKLDTLTGSTVILPPALGTGGMFWFIETVAPTSNNHIVKVANSVDVMMGLLIGIGGAASDLVGYAAAAADDTITLNRTTTGGTIRGEWFELIDMAPGLWFVRGAFKSSGVQATPFSSTV